MGTGPGSQPPLKVDPELLRKYGQQLLTAAGDLPEVPAAFTVTGTDAISQAIAEKLPALEGAIQEALPQLKDEASNTASNVVEAAGRYSSTDAQLAADYEKHQFDSVGGAGGGSGSGGGGGSDAMGQMGEMMSMPMQMAAQAPQLPMQAMSVVGRVPQGVQQIGQMAGGMGGSGGAAQPDERRGEDQSKEEVQQGAAARDGDAERAPEPLQKAVPTIATVPQQSSPLHAAPDSAVDL